MSNGARPGRAAVTARAGWSAVMGMAGALALGAGGAHAQTVVDGISFEDVAGSGKVTLGNIRGGLAVLDYDRDGFMDLAIADIAGNVPNRLFRSVPHPTRPGRRTFVDVSVSAGLADADAQTRYGTGVVAADYDNDGRTDLYILGNSIGTGSCGLLYRNNGDGTFTNVTAGAGVREIGARTDSASWVDYDLDGWVDLFLAVGSQTRPFRLFHNNHDGTFSDATGLLPAVGPVQVVYAHTWMDYDGDGDPDCMTLAFANNAAVLLRNEADAQGRRYFTNAGGPASGYAVLGPAPMGIAAGDFDNDGDFDLSITTAQIGTYYRNDAGHMTLISPFSTFFGWGAAWIDADNDGWLDNYQAGSFAFSANADRLVRNLGNGQWKDVSGALNAALLWSQHAVQVDLDNDGRQDIVTVNPGGPTPYVSVYENNSVTGNHWLTLALEGDGVSVNPLAIGAVVRCRAGGVTRSAQVVSGSSTASGEDPRAHFGLGSATTVDWLEVTWPRRGTLAQRTEVFPGPFGADRIMTLRPYCPSDFDRNSFVTGEDFDGFVVAFERGDAAADANADGFVSGDDFDSFVSAFIAGC